ncbi:MAG: metallophosphoesterase [Kangiellaceae bacterium]|nr:metallophosphoesterase [Kangiellaceae bacterium]
MHIKSKATLKQLVILLTIVTLSACQSLSKDKNSPPVIAAYSMYAPANDGSTLLYARAIVNSIDANCPILSGSDRSRVKMTPRGLHPGATNFPVKVCEASISAGVSYKVSSSKFELAAATNSPSKVLVFGDSGCEPKDCKPGEAAQPFSNLAEEGAKVGAELILHMGDYNYRGTSGSLQDKPKTIYAYDAGDGGYGGPSCGYVDNDYYSQNASDSTRPDKWQYWYEDFFLPAKHLLVTAPWVFSRGNHELCSRAGLGWFYFFGPGSSLTAGIPQLACPNQGSIAHPFNNAVNSISMVQPYVVSLEPLDLWVVDSANACDASADNPLTAQYSLQIDSLQLEQLKKTQSAASKPVWMMTHRPTWGATVDTQDGADPVISSMSVMLQTAVKETESGVYPESVKLLLSGHMHLYQDVSFLGTKRPPQVVVGNSGVKLNKSATGNYQATIDDDAATINQFDGFGFMLMTLGEDGNWTGSYRRQFFR